MNPRNKLLPVLIASLLTFAGTLGAAPFSFNESFDGAEGLPPDWVTTWTETPFQNGEGQLITVRDGSGHNRVAYTGGNSDMWSDYTITSSFSNDVWAANSAFAGLMGRIQPTSNLTDERAFYGFYAFGDGRLRIQRRDWDGATNTFTTIAELSGQFSYQAGEVWLLEFSMVGDQLTGGVYNDVGVLQGSITTTDSTYASGHGGIYSLMSGGEPTLHHDFEATGTAIPEPGTTALLMGLGGVVFLVVRRFKRA